MNDEVKNPFPGLRPFEFEDNHLFFGRDEQTTELTTRLRKNRFVAVVGTSGSGKSSLVRAGLLPELLSGTMAGVGSSWETAIMRPGGDPLTNLANSIIEADLYDPDEEDIASQVRATLTRSGLGLVEAMRQSDLPEGTNFLLVVDQFEEIFRFRRSDDATDEQAAFFVNLLLEASAQTDVPLYIIITMRSDFLGDCSQFPRLADTVNEGEFLIPRLNRDQRKEAILGPVKVASGGITDRLLLRLLNDIGDDPDQLPILQHALMRTWDLFEEQGGKGDLDLEHYDATGGMTEALSRHADEVYSEQPDEEHKRIAQKLFKSLTEKVDANRGIRRPMALRELHEICGGEESHLRDVVDSFRKTGCTFLMPAGEREIKPKSIIDISHESLMRVWRSLRNWVDEEAQSAKIYRRLADTASLYKERKAGLYRDPDLQIALSWREENRPNKTWADRYYPGFEGAMAFLDKSHEESIREDREREEARKKELEQANALARARTRTARIFKYASCGIAVLAIVAVMAMINARKSRDIAETAILKQAQRSEDTANRYIEEGDNTYAVPWLVDSINLSDNSLSDKLKRSSKLSKLLMHSIKTMHHYNLNDSIIDYKIINTNSIGILLASKYCILDERLNLKKTIELKNYFKSPICFNEKSEYIFGIINNGDLGLLNINTLKLDEFKLTNEEYEDSIKANFSPNQQYITFLTNSDTDNFNILNVKSKEISKFNLNSPYYTHAYSAENQLFYITTDWENQSYKLNFLEFGDKPDKIYNEDLMINLNEGKIANPKYINGNLYFSINAAASSSKIIKFKPSEKNNYEVVVNFNKHILDFNYVEFNRTFLILNSDKNITLQKLPDQNNNEQNLPDENNSEQTENQSLISLNINSESTIEKFYLFRDFTNIITVNSENVVEVWDIITGQRKFNRFISNNTIKGIVSNNNCKDLYIIDENGLIKNIIYPTFRSEMDKYFSGFFETFNVKINNNKSYRYYKIIFPQTLRTLDNPENKFQWGRGIQFSEIEFLDTQGNEITNPSTIVKSTDGDELIWGQKGSPVGEEPLKAIDNNYSTKHFNFTNEKDYGLLFDFNERISVASFNLTSANDIPSRNPTKYILSGSNNGKEYSIISSGEIVDEHYINAYETYMDMITNDIRSVNYLIGANLSNNGNIVPIGDMSNYENLNNKLYYINKMHNDMYFNIKNLNKSIIDNNYSTLLHFDILSKNNKIQTQHLSQGARAYAVSNDFNNSYTNYVEAVRLNTDDIMSKIELAAVCLKLSKNKEFKSLIIDIIKSRAVIKDNILADNLIGFVVNTPVEIENDLMFKFKSDLAVYYNAIGNLINDDGSINTKYVEDKLSNMEINENVNTINRNYIELNEKKFNDDDLNIGFTIEYWVKKSDENDHYGWIFSNGGEGFGDGMHNGFSIVQLNSNKIRFELANANKGEKTMLDTPLPETDDWFHMAHVWNSISSEASTYIDGKLVGKSKFSGPIPPESKYVNLGRTRTWKGWNSGYWSGGLAELRIWKYPRTVREINRYKNTTINKKAKGLYEYIMLNQKVGNDIISSITGQKIANFYGPIWKSTKNIPISNGKDFYYASFGSISNNNNNLNQQNTLNWGQMSDFGKLQIQLGNYDEAISILDMVRFKSSNPSSKNDPTYYKTGKPWDLLTVCNAYLKNNDLNTARKLFNSIDRDNLPNESNFNWNGIRFHALMKIIDKRLN